MEAQTPQPGSVDQYRQLVEGVELKEIVLREVEAKRTSDKPGPWAADAKLDLNGSFDSPGDMLHARVTVKVTATQHDSGEEVAVISATWLVHYHLRESLLVSDDLIQTFVQRNVPVNIWPYVRELVSSLTIRMGMPPLLLPVLKILR